MAQTLQHSQESFRLPGPPPQKCRNNSTVHIRLNIEKSARTMEVKNKQLEPTPLQIENWARNVNSNDLQHRERLSLDLDVMWCKPLGIRIIRKSFNTVPRLLHHQHYTINREVEALRSLKHPNLVRLYGTAASAGELSVYVFSEFCEGGNLESIAKAVIKRSGIIGEAVLGKICEGILNGLTFLESKCITVAELQPRNVFISREGEIKLNGYDSCFVDQCMSQVSVPKPVYASPERIRGDQCTFTGLTWSLGIITLELAENKYPFNTSDSGSLLGLLIKIVKGNPPELGSSNPWSDQLRCFTKTCLIKDPKHRPSSSKLIEHPFILWSKRRKVNMKKWIRQVWEWGS